MANTAMLSKEEFFSLTERRANCICLKCPHGKNGLCFAKPNCQNCYHPEGDPENCDRNCFTGLK